MSSAAPTDKLIERGPPVLKANNGAEVTPSTSNNENLSLNKVQKPISPGQAVKSVQEDINLPQTPTNDKLTEKLKSSKDKPTAKNSAKCDPPPEERKQYK